MGEVGHLQRSKDSEYHGMVGGDPEAIVQRLGIRVRFMHECRFAFMQVWKV